MKDTMSDSAARFRRGLLSGALFLCLVATISFALVYRSKASIPPPGIDNSAAGSPKGADLREAGRQAVLHWMAENSAMSDNVLSDIYGTAANTAHRDLILAVCLVESNYNPRAVSDKGAMGLMGIMPGIWLDELQTQGIVRKREDLYKIANNIAAGTYVLERYISRTGNLRKALIRYEGGDAWYATRVLKAMNKISLVRHTQHKIYLASISD
ncbi:MAG: transglycosylase SLT domain-containing protein [Candidatus Sulfobium sp.]|jgi:soluble lytic murein transglycosylase-like protein